MPSTNPFRAEAAGFTTSYLEFGSVKDSLEYKYLKNMDPYLNLKKNTDYPSVLVLSQKNDARIHLFETGKYIARLQEYSTSNNPILYLIGDDSGHGGGGDYVLSYSRLFAFAFEQTNHEMEVLK